MTDDSDCADVDGHGRASDGLDDCEVLLFFGLGASEVTGGAVVCKGLFLFGLGASEVTGGAIDILDEDLEVTDGAAEVLLADGALALVLAGRTEDAAFLFAGVGGIMSSSSLSLILSSALALLLDGFAISSSSSSRPLYFTAFLRQFL